MKRGLFLVLEGGEGVGKTTNMQFIQQYLSQHNIPFIHTREPGGTPLAEEIRQLLLVHREETVADMTELLLMFAARAQHLAEKIMPTLAEGTWVLCDRFTDASYAYQGGGRQLNTATIEALEQLVQGDLRPDCVMLLDADVEVGQQRARERAALDRLEQENLDFHRRVRQAYLHRAQQAPECYALINAEQSLEQVQLDIATVLAQLITRWQQGR